MSDEAAPTDATESPPTEAPPINGAATLAPPDPPAIVTATQWRRVTQRRYRVHLPSRTVVVARRIDSASLLLDGTLSQEDALKLLAPTGSKEELLARVTVCRRAAAEIVREPRVVAADSPDALDPDVMSADDIPAADALALVAWSLGVSSSTYDDPIDPDE